MSVGAIGAVGAVGAAMPAMPTMPTASGTAGTSGTSGTSGASGASGAAAVQGPIAPQSASGAEFGNLLADGLDRLQGLQNSSSNLAVKAATGDLSSIHDYTIAAAEASTATDLTVSLRNTAVQAFNQIMSMQV